MQRNPNIHFLRNNNEINKQRWDECVIASPNGLIYAQSFYLDNICPGWKALIGDEYEWVLPITDRMKFGIAYLYQPPFTQQLGIFARENVIVPYKAIIQWLKQHFKFWEINWNYGTDIGFIIPAVQTTAATNFVVDLSADYESIAANYHKDVTKNIKRSKHFHLVCETTGDYSKCIDLYKNYYGGRMSHVKFNDYERFSKICNYAYRNDMLHCRQAVNNEGELLAIVLLLSDGKRLYNLMNVTTEQGRRTEANHFLLDAVIRAFSGRELLFDFEGSDIPGVKTFYKNFGAENQPFYMLKHNNLRWPFKLLKR